MNDSTRNQLKKPGSAPDDASIPMLTERLTLPPLEIDFSLDLPTSVPGQPAAQRLIASSHARAQARTASFAEQRAAAQPAPAPVSAPTPSTAQSRKAPPTLREDDPLADIFAPSSTPFVMTVPPQVDDDEPAPTFRLDVTSAPSPVLGATARLGPAQAAQSAAQPGSQRSASASSSPMPKPPPTLLPTSISPAAYADIELRENILAALAERLPQEVESLMRQHLQPVIDEAIERIAAQTRVAIAASLRDIVDRAVQAEMERLRER